MHLFPQEHYAALARAFPEARHLRPGGLGENLSTAGITEDNACIGDVFALGTVRLPHAYVDALRERLATPRPARVAPEAQAPASTA